MNVRIPMWLVARVVARVVDRVAAVTIGRGDHIVALAIDPDRAELRVRDRSGAVTTLRVDSQSQRRSFAVVAALLYVKPSERTRQRARAYLRIGGLPYALDMLLHLDRQRAVSSSASPLLEERRAHSRPAQARAAPMRRAH
jgi:hypothetical protein